MPSLLLKKFLWSQFYILNWLSSKQKLDTEETWESYENKASPWSFKISAACCIDWDQCVLNSVNSQTWSIRPLVFFTLVIQVEL